MIFAQTSIIFCVGLLQIGDLLAAGDYSSDQCQGTATTCSIPTPDQFQRAADALVAGGCTAANSPEQRQRFVDCAKNFNPELDKNITELANSDQQCRDEADFDFQQPGVLGECEIFGTSQSLCFSRCVSCLRYKAFGFDSTELSIQQYEACNMDKTMPSSGTYA